MELPFPYASTVIDLSAIVSIWASSVGIFTGGWAAKELIFGSGEDLGEAAGVGALMGFGVGLPITIFAAIELSLGH